jgi:CheY-like chemotaxis protein
LVSGSAALGIDTESGATMQGRCVGYPPPLSQLMGRRILIADDVQDSANALKALLAAHGHEVHTAYDGAKALASTVDARPDVVILDLQMPGLNGLDVCRAIRRHDWGKKMLLIAHTGWAREEDIRRASEAGFDLHMAKPVRIEKLLLALQRGGEMGSTQ